MTVTKILFGSQRVKMKVKDVIWLNIDGLASLSNIHKTMCPSSAILEQLQKIREIQSLTLN